MNAKTLLILIILLALGAAVYLLSKGDSIINSAEKVGSSIIPDLYAALNQVDELKFTAAGNKVIATLMRQEDKWVVAERNNYPADIAKIRKVVLSLAEAKILEQKTSNEELYSKLNVQNIIKEDAGGIQVSVRYDDKNSALIIGKPGPQINKNRYVRRADEATSWLVDRKLDVQYEVTHWLRKDILSVEPAEIAKVTIILADGSKLEIQNDGTVDNNFFVSNLSDPDAQVIDAELHQVTNALSSFRLLDVTTQEEFGESEPTMQIAYHLKSGADIRLVAFEAGSDHFVRIEVGMQAEATESTPTDNNMQAFVRDLKNKTNNWIFKIPNVSYDSMYKREQDVLAITEDQLN